jgi:hypothetical protein
MFNAKEYNRKYYLDNKDKMLQRNALWKEENRARFLYNSAKTRALKAGIPFNIEVTDIVIPEVCPILGIPIIVTSRKGRQDNSPSLDKIDNSLGYIKGNVQVISWLANNIKGNRTQEELVLFCNGYLNFLSNRSC